MTTSHICPGGGMSLVARHPRNHPQQVAMRLVGDAATDAIDCRETPDDFFASVNAEHGFTLDAAANRENAKVAQFFDRASDGLSQPWAPHVVWCNPPFSNIGAWVAKAIAETRHGGCPKVVMLLPANRTEQVWWQILIEPVRDRELGISTRFLRGRLKFKASVTLESARKPGENRPPFGCVLVTFEPNCKQPVPTKEAR